MRSVSRPRCTAIALLVLLFCASATAQDLEPRRWSLMPTGINFVGVGMGYSFGDILLDPVLEIEDAEFDLSSFAFGFVHSFSMFGKSARFDMSTTYHVGGTWRGLLQGQPAQTKRAGLGDPRFRLSLLLYGAPAQTPAEFATTEQSNTVVGVAIAVTAPLGEYFSDKLINLGSNRWVFRPQLGITHTRGKWTYELTGSAFLFTNNNEFFGDTKLETDPLWALQGHFIYTFRPGLWVSLSTAYGNGADPKISGVKQDVETSNWLSALSMGVPIDRTQGLKFTWLRARTQESTGTNLDSLILSYSRMFR